MLRNRKKIIVIFSIFMLCSIIILVFFITNNYKKIQTGNTIRDKNIEEIEEYILNISSYRAEIEVTVESNKNTNKYVFIQRYSKPNLSYQEAVEPENIKGLTIKYDGNNIQISNSRLNLNTMYENYTYIADNVLWLSTFIENYKQNNGKIYEENGMIVMETNCNENKYSTYEKLYIDKEKNKISKLVIYDENKKNKIYIIYNKMEISNSEDNEVLAYKNKILEAKDI